MTPKAADNVVEIIKTALNKAGLSDVEVNLGKIRPDGSIVINVEVTDEDILSAEDDELEDDGLIEEEEADED